MGMSGARGSSNGGHPTANRDVWTGAAWWAAKPWWGDHVYIDSHASSAWIVRENQKTGLPPNANGNMTGCEICCDVNKTKRGL